MIISIKNGEVINEKGTKKIFLKIKLSDGGYLATHFKEMERCILIFKAEPIEMAEVKLPKLIRSQRWLERYNIQGCETPYEIYSYLGNYRFHVCASFSQEKYIIEYKGKIYEINNTTFFALNLPCPDKKIKVSKVELRLIKRFDPDDYPEIKIITDNEIKINKENEIENYEEIKSKYGDFSEFMYRVEKGWHTYRARIYHIEKGMI